MFYKILPLLVFLSVVSSVYIDTHKHSPESDNGEWQYVKVYHPPKQQWYKYDHYTYPKYEFEYAVSDKKTGDHKHHQEFRDGDRVHGEYSLIEPDGSLRKVEYKADHHTGFNAVVSKGFHKHGNHAYSIFGHTRYFTPVHEMKIKQYFPEYQHNSADMKEQKSSEIKPAIEMETMPVLKEEAKLLAMKEIGDNVMVVEPKMVALDNNLPDKEKDMENTKEAVSIPEVVSMIQPEIQTIDVRTGDAMQMMAIKNDVLDLKPVTEMEEKDIPVNIMEAPKMEVIPDSSVASSYYRSKIYYGFV